MTESKLRREIEILGQSYSVSYNEEEAEKLDEIVRHLNTQLSEAKADNQNATITQLLVITAMNLISTFRELEQNSVSNEKKINQRLMTINEMIRKNANHPTAQKEFGVNL